jgi:hypothetical protein
VNKARSKNESQAQPAFDGENLALTYDEISLVRSLVANFGASGTAVSLSRLGDNYTGQAVSILRKIESATNTPSSGRERDWLSLVDPCGGFLSEEDQQKVNAAGAVSNGFDVDQDTRRLAAQAVVVGLVESLA